MWKKWDVFNKMVVMCVQVCIDEVHQSTVLVLDTSSNSLCMASPCCHYPDKKKCLKFEALIS